MVFSSLTFLFIFLPLVLLFYFLLPGIRAKSAVLCLFSLVFYAWGEPVYVLLMIASILLNYLVGLGMARFPGRKKGLLVLALIFNLGAIGYFKYAGFFLSSLNSLFSLHLPALQIALPIGISFYTFQILSYVIDLYRGKVAVQRNFLSLLLYVSYRAVEGYENLQRATERYITCQQDAVQFREFGEVAPVHAGDHVEGQPGIEGAKADGPQGPFITA